MTDRELLDALAAAAPGVDKGRALFKAKYALTRRPGEDSPVTRGRDLHEARQSGRSGDEGTT